MGIFIITGFCDNFRRLNGNLYTKESMLSIFSYLINVLSKGSAETVPTDLMSVAPLLTQHMVDAQAPLNPAKQVI